MKNLIFILVFSIFITGCASVGSRVQEDYTSIDKGLYPGVRGDIDALGKDYKGSELQGAESIIYPLALVDLPIAVVLDTVLLPVDILEQSSKTQKIRDLASKHFPHYKIVQNNNKNASRFVLVSVAGETIEFDNNYLTNRRLNEFIKRESIIVSTETDAKEIVQLTMMIVLGDVDTVRSIWHYQVERSESSWKVSIRNKQGGQLGGIWVLDVDADNRLEKISTHTGF